MESNCRRSGNSYIQEVHRAIYGDTPQIQLGSIEYHHAAQNYALYGKDFLDFPENLTPLLSEKINSPEVAPFAAGSSSGYGNGLYPTPSGGPEASNVGFTNFGVSFQINC